MHSRVTNPIFDGKIEFCLFSFQFKELSWLTMSQTDEHGAVSWPDARMSNRVNSGAISGSGGNFPILFVTLLEWSNMEIY